jgi:hypothetical protein
MPSPDNRADSLPVLRTAGAPHSLSPAARLCAFALLVLLLFLCAREIGHSLGPVGTSHVRSVVTPTGRSGGGMGGMNMGAGPASNGHWPESAR